MFCFAKIYNLSLILLCMTDGEFYHSIIAYKNLSWLFLLEQGYRKTRISNSRNKPGHAANEEAKWYGQRFYNIRIHKIKIKLWYRLFF